MAGACKAPEPLPDDLVLFALGDWGKPGQVRTRVLEAVARHAQRRAPSAVLLLGDNFYPRGVNSAEDPRWRTEIEQPFAAAGIEAPILAILGNHDHDGSTQAQIEYSQHSPRWHMPSALWIKEFQQGDAQVLDLFALDTQAMRLSNAERHEQIEWLETGLRNSRARWKVVLGHHPAFSYGKNGPSRTIGAALAPLLSRRGVSVYLSGHEHDQQLVQSAAGWAQIVSGASSAPRPATGRGDGSRFASAEPGFACLIARRNGLWVEFVGTASGELGCFDLGDPAASRPDREEQDEIVGAAPSRIDEALVAPR